MSYLVKEINLRGLKVNYLHSKANNPDRPLLYFLHGFPDNAYAWRYLWENLETDYDWIAPFLPGTHDGERVQASRYDLDHMTMDHMQLLNLEEFAGRKVVFIGHDLGGPVANELNENLGTRSLGLILINTFSLPHFLKRVKDPSQLRKSSYMAVLGVDKIAEFALKKTHSLALNTIYNQGKLDRMDELRLNPPQVFQSVKIYRQYMKNALNLKSSVRNKNKKLLILGLKDPFLTVPPMNEVEKYYSNAQLRVIKANHWPHRNDPARVGKLIQQFLDA